MSRVIITQKAALDLENCRLFLHSKNRLVMVRASECIRYHLNLLIQNPEVGRLTNIFQELSHLRELVIPFGDSGYIALYLYDKDLDTVSILSFRHQKQNFM